MPAQPSLQMLFAPHEVRGATPLPLDPDAMWRIAFAATTYLRSILAGYDRSDPLVNRLIIACDGRPACRALYAALRDGVLSSDVGVLDLGEVDWPQLAFAAAHLKTAGGIMATAGALPVGQAGVRLVSQRGRPVTRESGLGEIARIADRVMAHGKPPGQQASAFSVLAEYRAAIRRYLPATPAARPITVVYDALGGVMGKVLPAVLGDVEGVLLLPAGPPPDLGLRGTPAPDVRDDARLARLAAEVQAQRADLGVAFDGDGRRIRVCDAAGRLVRPGKVLQLLCRVVLAEHKAPTVITEGPPDAELQAVVGQVGGQVASQRRGRAYFFKSLTDTHAVLGGDASGRYYFRDLHGVESPLATLAVLIRAATDLRR